MNVSRRAFMQGTAGLALSTGLSIGPVLANVPTVRIGVLADFSGIYNDLLGMGGVGCTRQAVVDFDPKSRGFNVEVLYADHLNKPDVGANIVRKWYDSDGVDMIIAGPNSAVALAAAFITKEKNKVCMGTSVTTMDFTGKYCTPNTVNWTYDGYMLSKAVAIETLRNGGKTWYFITTDNAFGQSLQAETTAFVEQNGGKVLGSSKYPIGTTDFSAMLMAAQSSGAQVLGLSLGGNDLPNCIKQADEFRLRDKMKVAALVMFLNDIHAAGLPVMQKLLFTNSFYWDTNDRTRAFTKRVLPVMNGAYPGMTHAGCYAVTKHYLEAVAAMGPEKAKASGAATVAQMKKMPTDDDAFGPGRIREDGRAVLPAYLLQVKTPEQSKAPWDYCNVISTMPAEETVKPLDQVGCPLVKS